MEGIFEISPFKFSVKYNKGDKWVTAWIKYDKTDPSIVDIYEKHELRKGLLRPVIAKSTSTPAKRAELFTLIAIGDDEKSHCGLSN